MSSGETLAGDCSVIQDVMQMRDIADFTASQAASQGTCMSTSYTCLTPRLSTSVESLTSKMQEPLPRRTALPHRHTQTRTHTDILNLDVKSVRIIPPSYKNLSKDALLSLSLAHSPIHSAHLSFSLSYTHLHVDILNLFHASALHLRNEIRIIIAKLQESLQASTAVLWPLTLEAVRQKHHEPTATQPLLLPRADELVDDDLSRVGKVAKLRVNQVRCTPKGELPQLRVWT